MKKIAKRYSKALFQSLSPADWDSALSTMVKLTELFSNNQDLKTSLLNPAYSVKDRANVLTHILDKILVSDSNSKKIITGLIHTLLNNGRLKALPQITEELKTIINGVKKILSITVKSATPIAIEKQRSFSDKLKAEWGSSLDTLWEVDPTLIAGGVIFIGDSMVDSSIKGRLKKIKEAISL